MAVTSQQILDFLLANPGMSDAEIASAMQTYNVTPAQMAAAVNVPVSDVESRYNASLPFVNPVIEERVIDMGDGTRSEYYIKGTNIQADAPTFSEVAPTTGLTESSAPQYQANNFTVYDPQAKGEYVYSPQGELIGFNPGERSTSIGGFLNEVYKDNKNVINSALLFGALDAAGLLGGGAGTAGGAAGVAGMGGGTGLTAGAGGLGLSTGGAGLGAAGTGAGITAGTGLGTGVLSGSTLGTGAAGLATGVGAGAGAAGTGLLTSAVKAVAPTVGSLVSSGLTTAGGLLQSQTSKEAAQKAQAMIDAETAAAKKAAQFSPVGMTTRFGTSEFKVDPTTGKLTSAGYTLSPEAKAAQDRFVKLAEQGIQQAEGAQKAFEPLQTGAQSLFTLGNKYLAQSPEQVAQDYMNKQLALLQPGRELELANLQNKLQQQGRAGLSVSQGGNLGATTPELQALFNARAQQEALLAANAQQAGQQNVMFGAGLLGTGAQTMGQYYGGQQAAYSPYTTAMGQVQGLETAGQQPFTMGVNLGQIGAQAGANVGQLGLKGAGASVDLATGADATRNLTAVGLGGLGSSGLLTTGINTAVQAIGQRLEDFPSLAASSNQLDPASVYRSAIVNF